MELYGRREAAVQHYVLKLIYSNFDKENKCTHCTLDLLQLASINDPITVWNDLVNNAYDLRWLFEIRALSFVFVGIVLPLPGLSAITWYFRGVSRDNLSDKARKTKALLTFSCLAVKL